VFVFARPEDMTSIALRIAELEQLRRSIVMTPNAQRVFTQGQALELIDELVRLYQDRQGRVS
jgi:hypothetical protein